MKMQKRKVDNRATCNKVVNAYLNDRINTANDVANLFFEAMLRTEYGSLGSSGLCNYKDEGIGDEDCFYETVSMVYPNSRVDVLLGYEGKQDTICLFEVTWIGRNGEVMFESSYSPSIAA